MRAARLTAQHRIELEDIDEPEVSREDEVLVKLRAAGVCGTDLHFVEGLLDPGDFPRILGHEIAGVVTEGSERFEPGQQVAVYNVLYCGACTYCRSGRQRLCAASRGMLGFNVDGGFAEYIVVPERNLVPLPDSVASDTAAVLACSGMTAIHAVRLSDIGLGDVVVVDGIGGVGLMVTQVAAAAGARVIAVGDRRDKLDKATSAGASDAILISTDAEYANLKEALARIGVRPTAFFETVGTSQSMMAGYESLAPGGSFVQIGYTKDRIDIHPSVLIRNELRLLTSAAGSLADLEAAIQLAATGAIQASVNICTGLDQLSVALERIRSRTVLGRSVIAFN